MLMKKYAVIVAGGTGKRMGSAIPKQFLLLNDKPVLYYTIKTFLEAYNDLQIILVLPEEYADMGKEIIDAYFDSGRILIGLGGETRFHSVQNGLRLVQEEAIVLVHDPHTFHSKILLPAFEIDYKERFTDEATVVEDYGLKISLVEGEENNIKITQPVDL